MNRYTRALGEAIVERLNSLIIEGKRPVGLRLMPAEVKAIRAYIEATMGPDSYLQPIGGGLNGPQILGMAIIEVARPIPVEERFMLDDDTRPKDKH
jgi:hypothetical protein